jgi:hypothetical protein
MIMDSPGYPNRKSAVARTGSAMQQGRDFGLLEFGDGCSIATGSPVVDAGFGFVPILSI